MGSLRTKNTNFVLPYVYFVFRANMLNVFNESTCISIDNCCISI